MRHGHRQKRRSMKKGARAITFEGDRYRSMDRQSDRQWQTLIHYAIIVQETQGNPSATDLTLHERREVMNLLRKEIRKHWSSRFPQYFFFFFLQFNRQRETLFKNFHWRKKHWLQFCLIFDSYRQLGFRFICNGSDWGMRKAKSYRR